MALASQRTHPRMAFMFLVGIFSVLTNFQLILVDGQNCDTLETCDCSELTLNSTSLSVVNCSLKNLNQVPTGLPLNRYVYDFTDNQLSILDLINILLNLMVETIVKIFIFDKNPLSELPGVPPSQDPSIEFVSFEECQIKLLDENTFNGLARIHTIHLEFNEIASLPEKIFRSLEALRHLFMDNNVLMTLPSGLFETNTQLKEISFKDNKLTFLPDNVFAPISVIESLNVGGNDLYGFNKSIFEENQQILQLTYSPNPLTCNCSIRDLYNLARRLKDDFGGKVEANCRYPNDRGHLSIYDIDASLFIECEDTEITTVSQENAEKRHSAAIVVSTFAIVGTAAIGVSMYVAVKNTNPSVQTESQGRQSDKVSSELGECCFHRCLNDKKKRKQKSTIDPIKEKHDRDKEQGEETANERYCGQDIRLETV